MILHPGGAKLFSCNISCHESVLQQISVDAAWMCAVSVMSFLIVARDGPTNVMGNRGLPMQVLQQSVL
jgi:hypothetical protein